MSGRARTQRWSTSDHVTPSRVSTQIGKRMVAELGVVRSPAAMPASIAGAERRRTDVGRVVPDR